MRICIREGLTQSNAASFDSELNKMMLIERTNMKKGEKNKWESPIQRQTPHHLHEV